MLSDSKRGRYRALVKHPIDLQTILAKLDEGQYESCQACAADVEQVSFAGYSLHPG